MRTYTLVFSIVAHMVAVGALIIVPAFATDDLPEPYRTTAFVIVRPELPPPASIPSPRRDVAPSTSTPVPLTEPLEIQPEPIVEPVEQCGFDLGASPIGIAIGEIASTGDPIPPPPPVPARPKDPVRVGGVIQPPTRLVHVNPIYPPLALVARQGGDGDPRGAHRRRRLDSRRQAASAGAAVRGGSHRRGETVAIFTHPAQWRTCAPRLDSDRCIHAPEMKGSRSAQGELRPATPNYQTPAPNESGLLGVGSWRLGVDASC